jgi:hypothetical protein
MSQAHSQAQNQAQASSQMQPHPPTSTGSAQEYYQQTDENALNSLHPKLQQLVSSYDNQNPNATETTISFAQIWDYHKVLAQSYMQWVDALNAANDLHIEANGQPMQPSDIEAYVEEHPLDPNASQAVHLISVIGHDLVTLDYIENSGPEPPTPTQNLALQFASSLATVDVSDIPREDMRCPHCWGDFNEVNPEVDMTVVKTPCGHLYMRRCLVEAIIGTTGLCPVCRQDMRALIE